MLNDLFQLLLIFNGLLFYNDPFPLDGKWKGKQNGFSSIFTVEFKQQRIYLIRSQTIKGRLTHDSIGFDSSKLFYKISKHTSKEIHLEIIPESGTSISDFKKLRMTAFVSKINSKNIDLNRLLNGLGFKNHL